MPKGVLVFTPTLWEVVNLPCLGLHLLVICCSKTWLSQLEPPQSFLKIASNLEFSLFACRLSFRKKSNRACSSPNGGISRSITKTKSPASGSLTLPNPMEPKLTELSLLGFDFFQLRFCRWRAASIQRRTGFSRSLWRANIGNPPARGSASPNCVRYAFIGRAASRDNRGVRVFGKASPSIS